MNGTDDSCGKSEVLGADQGAGCPGGTSTFSELDKLGGTATSSDSEASMGKANSTPPTNLEAIAEPEFHELVKLFCEYLKSNPRKGMNPAIIIRGHYPWYAHLKSDQGLFTAIMMDISNARNKEAK